MIDVHTVNQKKNKERTQIITIRKKKMIMPKMIDVHTVNQKKKKVHRFLHACYKKKKKTKIQSTNHLNSSSHLILILSMEYIHLFIISRLKDFFCLFILQYFFDQSSLLCDSINLLLHSTPLHSYSPHNFTNYFQFMCVIHSTNNYT